MNYILLFPQIERNCESLLPDFGAFLNCLEPCANIGTNCFQRCAFKTDEISATCLSRCHLSDVGSDVSEAQDVLVLDDVGGDDVSTSHRDNIDGTLCYKSCYDELLNSAMNR